MAATRVCTLCEKAKTVNGVWYIQRADHAGSFVCGTCFSTQLEAPEGAPTMPA